MLSGEITRGMHVNPNNEMRRSRERNVEMSVEMAAERLNVPLAADDLQAFTAMLSTVIKARGGYTAAARATGLNRTALYKVASREGNPALDTLVALLASMGLRLSVQPMEREADHGAGTTYNTEGSAFARAPAAHPK